MSVLRIIYNTILDSLFPRPSAERESLSYSPEEALNKLPAAPTPPLVDAHSIFAYKDGRVSKLVWSIKYKKSPPAVAIGGYALYSALTKEAEHIPLRDESHRAAKSLRGMCSASFVSATTQPIIIPIPITQKRRNERGFNQCELLVDEMKRLDRDDSFSVIKNLLIRTHHSSRQTLKNRAGRLESAQDIFAINEKAPMPSENSLIVIIDDVITTGSTMNEAMKTLKDAGFKRVFGLSLAH